MKTHVFCLMKAVIVPAVASRPWREETHPSASPREEDRMPVGVLML